MTKFENEIARLVSKETSAARSDPERMADTIEILARILGFTIALFAKGDGKTIDTMLAGAEAYAHSEAVAKTPVAKLFASLGGAP